MRLLLAEDEKELSDALVEIFKLNHFSVDAVYDGQEALEYLATENYDGVVLDIMMPKVDGITVLKQVRAKGIKIPILLLTAKSEIDDRVLGLDSGADDYLTKPFSTKELLARIRAMTRRERDVTDSVLHFGNITLNRVTFELSSDKGTFRLANKEFQLLEMLINNQGKFINTEQLMERIWGYDSESEINVVWAHISYIRKKLSLLNSNVELKAVRNMGYILEIKK
ncbi:MAG: response regulator transcription factor [Oscillospiraceae bacterium]